MFNSFNKENNMKKLLAIIALISIASLADARVGVGRPGVGVGGVGRPGVGVGRPVARAAVTSEYVQGQSYDGQTQTYPNSYSTGRPVARGAVVRGAR